MLARSSAWPFGATSATLSATTSQPRSLLSIAKLNIAKSRLRPSTCSLVRINQTYFGCSGGLAPVNFPLFQGARWEAIGIDVLSYCIGGLLCYRGHQHAKPDRSIAAAERREPII